MRVLPVSPLAGFFTGRILCGRRAQPEHFLSLATRSRSLREEPWCVAVGLGADACLLSVCLRSADAKETELHGAWRERGAQLRCAQSGPRVFPYGGFPCSPVSMPRRTPACAARDVRRYRESFVLAAAPCLAL